MFAIPLTPDAELRSLEPWQAGEFFAHIERARELVSPWIRFAAAAPDLASAHALLQRYADKQAVDSGRLFGIWDRGTLVGGCMFPAFDAESGVCEIGVWTEPAGQGRGLVSTSVRHLLDYALLQRGLTRAEWHCSPQNERSWAVAKRMGMTMEGVLRSAYVVNGQRQDTQVWSVLRDEWIGLRRAEEAERAAAQAG